MKKKFSILLFMAVSFMTTYAQSEKDKYDVINTYMSLLIKDTTKTIVVVKEKISPNTVIKLFTGGAEANFVYSKKNVVEDPDFGIQKPLFKWSDVNKMRNKYRDDANDGKYGFAKNANWSSKDFNLKNIYFEIFDSIMIKKEKALPIYKYKTLLIALSDPMYYRNRKYLVIGIAIQSTSPLINLNYYVIVMKKNKNKWEVVQKGEKYWVE
ncbi:hypothetical protein [Flavobacterium sp. UGB4466]|uniref:hypothetical protein n=1 Tax=Flavobacterium sp. UGB4466 TaxID=2730889 RepID=UPI00192BDEF9|nr:hypothetical protein [Flavobacterium sp. UGB4466]